MSTQTLLLRISSLVGHTDCQPFRALAQSVSPTQLGDALSQLTLAAHLSLLNQLSCLAATVLTATPASTQNASCGCSI